MVGHRVDIGPKGLYIRCVLFKCHRFHPLSAIFQAYVVNVRSFSGKLEPGEMGLRARAKTVWLVRRQPHKPEIERNSLLKTTSTA